MRNDDQRETELNYIASELTRMTSTLSRVTFLPGKGNLPKLVINTPWSNAEIYLHGAQVTHFQKHGEAPLLFLSESSRFQSDSPIRGGIPICFPWFGAMTDTKGLPVPKIPALFANFVPPGSTTPP